jgi:glycosyltransferase involved in cell wall biosynthesis
MSKKIDIIIPTWEYYDNSGDKILKYTLDRIQEQTYTNYNVIISDNSTNDKIKNMCSEHELTKNKKLVYYPHRHLHIDAQDNGSPAGDGHKSLNFLVNRETNSDYIKILFQDDFFTTKKSLELAINQVDDNFHWYIWNIRQQEFQSIEEGGKFNDRHNLYYNDKIIFGNNTVGNPSAIMIKNSLRPFPKFYSSSQFTILGDCIFYHMMYQKYGKPQTLRSEIPLVTVRIWENCISGELRRTQTYDLKPEIDRLKQLIKNKEITLE